MAGQGGDELHVICNDYFCYFEWKICFQECLFHKMQYWRTRFLTTDDYQWLTMTNNDRARPQFANMRPREWVHYSQTCDPESGSTIRKHATQRVGPLFANMWPGEWDSLSTADFDLIRALPPHFPYITSIYVCGIYRSLQKFRNLHGLFLRPKRKLRETSFFKQIIEPWTFPFHLKTPKSIYLFIQKSHMVSSVTCQQWVYIIGNLAWFKRSRIRLLCFRFWIIRHVHM